MAVISTDQKQDHLNTVVQSTTYKKTKITNGSNKEEDMDKTCEKQDQSKMVITSTPNRKEATSNGDNKKEEIERTYDENGQLKMAVTPTDKKRKISNGEKKEEKIGTTCHQCRQKIKGLSAHCTNKKKDKSCPNKFCHKCLMNRYGEEAEEKSVLKEWNCPKCRGICNCSVCMKRRGHEPTGILVHTAKANGYSSVKELLRGQGPKALVPKKGSKLADDGAQNSDALDLNKEPADEMPLEAENENFTGIDLNSLPVPSRPTEKKKKRKRTEINDLKERDDIEEISLPRGTEMTTVAGINLLQEDVGHALQFLEFCTAFEEVLDLKEGEPIYILLELIRGGNGCRGKQSPVIRFHVILLSMILTDLENGSPVMTFKRGKDSWLNALQSCLSKSRNLLEKLKLDDVNLEVDEYENLSSSARLRILNFLCDEVLCTVKIRSWIEEQNAKFIENAKVSKEHIQTAKQKENQLKVKMQDEVGKAVANNENDLSIIEHETTVSDIKGEIEKAHAEVMEAKNMVTDEEQNCNAVRTGPLISEKDGRRYWKLKGYSDNSNLFLQDVGNWRGSTCSEEWFTIDAEQAKKIEERIRSLRNRKVTSQRLKFTYKADAIV